MRKKILSALLALCMVIGLLPLAAYAADLTDAQKQALKAQGYSDEEIANVLVVEEDTVLEEDETRLVVVIGQCTVTVRGAKLSTGIVVVPGAEAAKVVLEAQADVNAVVVLEKAVEVVVAQDAKAASLTVAAPEAIVTVSGDVSSVTVAETAEKAQVTVTDTAKVDTVVIDAADVTAKVDADASVVLGDNAENVAVTAGEDVKVEVSGNTGSLTEDSNVGDNAGTEDPEPTESEEPAESENPGESEAPVESTPVETPPVVIPPVNPGKPEQTEKPSSVIVADANATTITGTGAGNVAVAIPLADDAGFAYCTLTTDTETGEIKFEAITSKVQTGAQLGAGDAETSYDVITYKVEEGKAIDVTITQVADQATLDAIKEAVKTLNEKNAAKKAADAAKAEADKKVDAAEAVLTENAKAIAADALKALMETDTTDMSAEDLAKLVEDINTQLGKVGITGTTVTTENLADSITSIKADSTYTTELDKYTDEVAEKVAGANADIQAAKDAAAEATKAETEATEANTAFTEAKEGSTDIKVDITYEEPKASETTPGTEETKPGTEETKPGTETSPSPNPSESAEQPSPTPTPEPTPNPEQTTALAAEVDVLVEG